jgi:hypothetical protein
VTDDSFKHNVAVAVVDTFYRGGTMEFGPRIVVKSLLILHLHVRAPHWTSLERAIERESRLFSLVAHRKHGLDG